MLEFLNVLIRLTPTQFNEDAATQCSGRQLPANHAKAFWGKCWKKLRHLLVTNAAQNALPAGMATIDDRAQCRFGVICKNTVELVEAERWFPTFDGAIHCGFAHLNRRDALRH